MERDIGAAIGSSLKRGFNEKIIIFDGLSLQCMNLVLKRCKQGLGWLVFVAGMRQRQHKHDAGSIWLVLTEPCFVGLRYNLYLLILVFNGIVFNITSNCIEISSPKVTREWTPIDPRYRTKTKKTWADAWTRIQERRGGVGG